ncbi:50S ribosomal protein L2 [Patescibacteria group bacterium]|nr:50S ribosomal protein L2 [Patescibacteria group bacterium]
MAIKSFKPTTPGRRQMTVLVSDVSKNPKGPKKLTKRLKQHAGRNHRGKITSYHRGGGSKRKYRIIDFKGDKIDIPATVTSIEYDPNRTANIALLTYTDGEKRYIIAPIGLKVGDKVINSAQAELKTGNRLQLSKIPTGFNIHNIELNIGRGGQIVRSAGTSAQVLGRDHNLVQIKLPSSSIITVDEHCMATIGEVSNPDHSNVKIGKAGRNRWMGRRPKVRGKAKNPCDHPHGGGEGGSSIGMKYPKTPWGAHALGVKTRKIKKYSDKRIIKSRKKK